ncbi:PREDICTED: serine protease 42-like [Nicrophorus vespilloides]|uniref:Serine protease 42-like n=1 Tax=Nicrophorus vespilloides TaxID=110193 RepID=A0ABM1MQ64_NICVS|nr:PREDICTED: serine protease 42-like [Nicrophorus vespilloides]
MKCALLLFSFVALVCGQNDPIGDAIKEVFTQSPRSFWDSLGEEVTTKALETLMALERCGEGNDQGVHACVPYYNCDGKTKTIIQTGETDGFGVIDIRFGETSCAHPLDICCAIPTNGVPANVTTQAPVDPKQPEVTSPVPPITPGKGNFCGIRNPNGIDFKITGNNNNEAEYGEFPWMVAILRTNPVKDETLAVCGGSLITPNVVLTGAHCVQKYKTGDIKVRAGEWDTQTTRERIPYQERAVAEIIVHKQFHPQTLYNNVALLILEDNFVKADNLGTICMPPQDLKFDSKNCYATGWGKDVFGKQGQFQVILKKIELPIVQHDKCQDALRTTRLGKLFDLHKSFTCAGGEGNKDTCTGDGGSPLVCPDPQNPGRYLQAGIVSWGIGCGTENVPGVYADVAQYRNWIDAEMKKQNLDTMPYSI